MQNFEDVVDGECVYMGNSTTTRVMSKGNLFLKFNSDKLLSFSNILYVPSIHRNIVFGTLLTKAGLKADVGDDKVVISYNGVCLRKGYLNGSLFAFNLALESLNKNAFTYAYIAECVDLWYGRFGHVNFTFIK